MNRASGFSLIEMMVVVAILGILAVAGTAPLRLTGLKQAEITKNCCFFSKCH
jgi:prepilin-type N-terminal cleavage/methylation domain-containing protein